MRWCMLRSGRRGLLQLSDGSDRLRHEDVPGEVCEGIRIACDVDP